MQKLGFRLFLIVLTICTFTVLLSGCNNAPTENTDMISDKNNTKLEGYEVYPLESQEITIWIGFYSDHPQVITISDPDEIALLVNSVKFSEWEKPKLEERYQGMNYYYIQFNDKTTIAMYDTVAYGDVGTGKPNELGNLQNVKAEYNMPAEFLQAVQQLVEKHTK